MVAPVTRLYIHAPLAPRSGRDDLGAYRLEAQFAWHCNGPNAKSGIGCIQDMPYADEAYVFIPTIDVRFVSLIVPAVSRKKLQTILPTLLEEHLLTTQLIQTVLFVPRAGQMANQRIVAVMDRTWYDWITQQLKQLIAPRIVVLADCFVLPAPEDKQLIREFNYSPDGSMLSMQVRRTGLQTGVAFLEHGAPAMSSQLQWDWSWVSKASFDEAALQTNLMQHTPRRAKSSQPSIHGQWPQLIRQVLLRLNITIGIALGAIFIYSITLYALDWKWQSDIYNISSQVVRTLPPPTGTSIQDRPGGAIVSLIDAANRAVHRQGQLSSSDFVTLASQLNQLRAQLPADAIAQIDYQDGYLTVQMRPGIDSIAVIAKAKELGMALMILDPQRFRLLANAGLEFEAKKNDRGLP